MKQLLITLAMALTSGSAIMAQTVNDSLSATNDSVNIAEAVEASIPQFTTTGDSGFLNTHMVMMEEVLFPIIITSILLLTTIAVIFIIFYFRHKTKKAQYELVSQALAAGKELPKELFTRKEQISNDIFAKGVKNATIGLGLGILFWAITGEFGIGCIGFTVMLMGIGQIIIYKVQQAEDAKRKFCNDPQPADKPDSVKNEIVEEQQEEKEVEIIIPENYNDNKAE